MIRIEKNQIETEGSLDTQITDALMVLDFIYEQIEKDLGTKAAEQFLKRMPKTVIRGKRKERR